MLLCVHRVFCDSHCQLLFYSCSSCFPPTAVWRTCVGFPPSRKKCSSLTSLLSYPDNVQNFFFLEQDGCCYLLLQHYSMWRVLLKLPFPKSCFLNCTRNWAFIIWKKKSFLASLFRKHDLSEWWKIIRYQKKEISSVKLTLLLFSCLNSKLLQENGIEG